jgi:hypothetical protein
VKRVLAAMSGGVDSAVAAALVAEQGCEVTGVTLKLWCYGHGPSSPRACCTVEAVEDARQTARRMGFPHHVVNAEDVFRERVQGYEQVLRAVSGLFASSRKVERIDFQTFVRNLKMETIDLQGVGYSVLVPEQLRALAAVRAEGFRRRASPRGERPFYLGSSSRRPRRLAQHHRLRLFAEPSRRAAMEQARDTAGVAVSTRSGCRAKTRARSSRASDGGRCTHGAPLATVQERRENIVGWIFAAFSMEGLLGSTRVGERGSLALEVFDGSELQGEAGAAASSESVVVDRVGGESSLRLFSAAKRVEAGGHTWMVTAQALPNFATPIAISQLQLVTIVGGASSVALALFTWALMRRRLRSLRNREGAAARERSGRDRQPRQVALPGGAVTTCASRRRRWPSSQRCGRWRRSHASRRTWGVASRRGWRWRGRLLNGLLDVRGRGRAVE